MSKVKMKDDVSAYFDYNTAKFWIAVVIVFLIQFIPIPMGEEDIALILFKAMWNQTQSVYFLIGMIAVEIVIILFPFVLVQRFLVNKCGLK